MNYKAIFFDMDGTLTSLATHQVPESALLALRLAQQNGVKIFLATGRHPLLFNPIINTIPFDGYLTSNGQLCYTNTREVIHRNGISQADKEALVKLLETEHIPILFLSEQEVYLNMTNQQVQDVLDLLAMPPIAIKDPKTCLTEDIFALFLSGGEALEQAIMEVMPGSKTVRWSPLFTDIIPKTGGKDTGIDAMLTYYGIPLSETMAFGDAHNDIAMLSHVGLGIAMGNAAEEVKSAAKYVTDSAEEDGIYHALKHFGII